MAEKYQSVNGAWPEGTNEGRNLKPTPQEAMAGAKRLYRIAFGKPFKGTMKLTSGNRFTYIRNGVFYVNPDYGAMEGFPESGGGWHEIVHGISHYACSRLHPNAKGHGHQHAFIERELIKAVVSKGWLEGKLRREPKIKAPADPAKRIVESLARWQSKRKRAETAIRKLERKLRYYERKAA